MKAKFRCKRLLFIALFVQSFGSYAATFAEPHQWHFEVAGSGVWTETPAIVEGSTSDSALTSNLNNRRSFGTFSPLIGVWLPLATVNNYSYNGVANVSYTPINGIRSNSDADGSMNVIGKSLNFMVGVEVTHPINNAYFSALRLGGGVSQQDYTFTAFDDRPSGEDNATGNINVLRPFFSIQAGLGKQLSVNTQVMAFVRYDRLFNNDTIWMASTGDDESYVILNPARSVLSLGLSVTC